MTSPAKFLDPPSTCLHATTATIGSAGTSSCEEKGKVYRARLHPPETRIEGPGAESTLRRGGRVACELPAILARPIEVVENEDDKDA